MKTFFAWVVGIGGLLLAGAIMGGPNDIDNPNVGSDISFYERLGRWIVGIGVIIATYFAVKAINRASGNTGSLND